MDHPEEQPGGVVDHLLEQATDLSEQGAWEEAESLVRDGVARIGEEPALLCWLGVAAQQRDADGIAHLYFRRCLAADPADPVILAVAGQGLAWSADPDAEAALRLAALTAPGLKLARFAYGAYLAREGVLAEAVAELEAARDLDPEDAEVRGELAAAYLRAGRPGDATVEWGEHLALDPDDAAARATLGLVLWEGGERETAAEELFRAAADAPEDLELQLLSAVACAAEGWEEEAWNALARAEAVAAGGDTGTLATVEEALDAGCEAAADFMRNEFAPSQLRELLARTSA